LKIRSAAQIAMPHATSPGKIAGPYFWPGIGAERLNVNRDGRREQQQHRSPILHR
jgi:hypothetical protein